MKKTGIILVVLLMSLISCSKDDDENLVNPLIGSWEVAFVEDDIAINQVLTFNANETGTMLITLTFLGQTETQTENFTWSATANNLTLVIGGETAVATYAIAGNKLTVSVDGETIVFTRK